MKLFAVLSLLFLTSCATMQPDPEAAINKDPILRTMGNIAEIGLKFVWF